mmetsp:Transcript_37463/g.73265  ORF Transcript_37463/g.73265 Transcript_37463/m.73265 type:complete len:103 (+) Transcript_37463:202-510(+)
MLTFMGIAQLAYMGDPYMTAPGTDYAGQFGSSFMPGPPETIYKDPWELQKSPDGPSGGGFDPRYKPAPGGECRPMNPRKIPQIEPMAAPPPGTQNLPCPPYQ